MLSLECINKCCDIVLSEMMAELHDKGKLPNKEEALDDFANLLYFSDCEEIEHTYQEEEVDAAIQEGARKISACCDALYKQTFKLLVKKIFNTLKRTLIRGERPEQRENKNAT